MPKGYQEVELFCAVAQIKAKILTKGGRIENTMNGRVHSPCLGCTTWDAKKISAADEYVEYETHQEVDKNREFKLTQTLGHQNLDEKAPIVVNMCSPF